MRSRGLFVQKLIHFFESMHLYENKSNECPLDNQENNENTSAESSGMKPTFLTNIAPSEANKPKTTSSEAPDNETSKSLPLLHSSVFLVPSLQMLFELVGYRPRQTSVFEIAELCHRLLKIVHTLNHPPNPNYSLGRIGHSLDDLTVLNRQRDILDNVVDQRPLCLCSLSTESVASEEKKRKSCPHHRPPWPAARGQACRVRRRSADEPTVRPFPPEKEEAYKFFGPPTLTEFEKEQNEAPTIEKMDIKVVNEISIMPCESSVESSEKTTAQAMEDFNTSVTMTIDEIQNSLSPPTSPVTARECGERLLFSMKSKSNRLKRKYLAKLPSTPNETDEHKIASVLARKRFLQQRLIKKEMRRSRRFFRDSLNPSIFSQFCSTKGKARCTDQIKWKSDPIPKNRPLSPNIDTWATLAERDLMLETFLYKCESDETPQPTIPTPKPKSADEIDLNRLFLKRLADIDPIIPCCCCSCHYRFTGFGKMDVATDAEVKGINAETQTTSFASYDEPGIWSRRKENRTKSEGGIEKQPMRRKAANRETKKRLVVEGDTKKQPTRPNTMQGGIENNAVRHVEGGAEKQLIQHVTGDIEKQSVEHVEESFEKQTVEHCGPEGGAEKQAMRLKVGEGGAEKQPNRHNVTRRFRDFINEQTSCVIGNKHQRANEKQETMEYRQFLLSRFLEDSANHSSKPDDDTKLIEAQKPDNKF